MQPALTFAIGLGIIVLGAEALLRGATRLSSMLRIKPIIVGLTVVAVGTSAPELAVGITAALESKGALAVGNIAGTNIFNILFILGLSAALRPLPLQLQSIRLDVPVMIAAALVLYVMSLDGVLTRTEGALLVLGAIGYTVVLVRVSRDETKEVTQEFADEYGARALGAPRGAKQAGLNLALLLGGIALTVWGADLMVDGAAALARSLGVSDAVIGLTIVAIGTSAPELVTTLVATVRDERDVAVGNLVGSSISNIFVILGVTCLAAPAGVDVSPDVLRVDLPLGAAVAIACWPVFRSGQRVSRAEGVAFVAAYLVYLTTLVLYRA